jgi:hypothetical protein
MQECTEQGSRGHPTSLVTLCRDTSILYKLTVSRLNISQAGHQISRKGKVSLTKLINARSKIKDSSDIKNCISLISVREPAFRA